MLPLVSISFACYPAESVALISCETIARSQFPFIHSIKPASFPESITFSDFLPGLDSNYFLFRKSLSSETALTQWDWP
jgi:hypothetical protein